MATSSRPEYLSTSDAAKALAVSVSTVKRWVDEGVLPGHVTAGGHRKLLRSEVLALVRQGDLPRGEPAVLGGANQEAADQTPAAISSALFEALVGGNGPLTSSIIRRAYESTLTMGALADLVVAPAMAQVGHQWEASRLDIWQEHRGTQLCAGALYELKRELEARAERNRPMAVRAALEGDFYSLPTLLAQLVLLDAGWDAINLGPNTPIVSLTKAVRKLRPRLVWLSVTYIRDDAEFLRSYADFYRIAEENGTAVAVGGQAIRTPVRSAMSYTTYGDGLSHLEAFARSLHPRPRRRAGAGRMPARSEVTMKPRRVEVHDLMQQGYVYILTQPIGMNFHSDFKPELTPKQMLELGVFGGKYMTDCAAEFPADWFEIARLCPERHDPKLNYFGVNASQSLAVWRAKGWINSDDPRGWFQWYCRYYHGRRGPDDERQIRRWKAMRRHIAQIQKHCRKGDVNCRRRHRQALLHWAYDSRRI